MLWRKMIRDIKGNAGSYLACLVLIVLGMLAFLTFAIARDNMTLAKEVFYEEQNFADGFVELAGIPQHRLTRVKRIEGVRQVTGRLKRDVQVYDPGREESVYLRLVSLDLEEQERLNNLMLLEGEPLVDRRMRVWIDRQFFDANNLELNQTLPVIVEGRVRNLEIAGFGISPEFVYPLRTERDIYNDPELFGIAFLPQTTMWRLFPGMDHVLNNIVFSMEPGTEFNELKARLETVLDRYGVIEVYSREDQSSHFILSEEINVITTLATFFPVLILSVAAFIIYIVLKRLVEQQRGQIGILKAFGYSRREIMIHYFSYSLVLAVTGGLAGGLLGMWLANPMTEMLYQFFHLPEIYEGFSLRYLGQSILLCLTVMGFAGYHGCKAALKLTPAQAMLPPAPIAGKKTFLEKVPGFTGMLTMQGRMAIRNLSRSRSRTAFVFFGIMISCAMVCFTWALGKETMPKFMFHPYREVQVYDARITLERPVNPKRARREVERFPELAMVEPIAEIPVTLSHRWKEENVLLMGLPKDGRLYNILDDKGNRVEPSVEGLILSERLADNLGVGVGETIDLESIFLRDSDDVLEVSVVAVVPQYIGMNAYMEISALGLLLRQGQMATSLLCEVAGTEEERRETVTALRNHFRESDLVAGVDSRWHLLDMMQEYWELAGWIIYIYILIGVIFCFAIIYISSVITLSERQRELASMRVLGMSSSEVLSVITFEQWFLSFFAVIAGAPLGRLILESFAENWSTDMYAMPAEMSLQSLLAGAVITLASIWAAQQFARRKIRRLCLVEVLKARE